MMLIGISEISSSIGLPYDYVVKYNQKEPENCCQCKQDKIEQEEKIKLLKQENERLAEINKGLLNIIDKMLVKR